MLSISMLLSMTWVFFVCYSLGRVWVNLGIMKLGLALEYINYSFDCPAALNFSSVSTFSPNDQTGFND